MKWVLVTGGTGFLGTNLCKRLIEEGKYVFAVDNHITSSRAYILHDATHYQFLFHDITKPFPGILSPHNKEIETIYHLACPTGVPNVVTFGEEMLLTCSVGTQNVLELAKAHGADVVFTSTSEVYGDPERFPQTEDYTGNVSPIGIRSPYEEGKRFAESLIVLYTKKYGLDTKIIRVFNTYGPYMARSDTRVIPMFLRQLKAQQPLTIIGSGQHTRTFCFVDDLLEGMLLIQQKGKSGEIYNLGSDEEITIAALADSLLALQEPHKGITYVELPYEDHHRRLPSLEKVKSLGWRMQTSLEEGLRRTLQWYGL